MTRTLVRTAASSSPARREPPDLRDGGHRDREQRRGARRPPGVRYSFTLHVESGRLLGHLRDVGPPLDESERPVPDTDSENGRGLALARVALDDLEYQRADAVCGATGILLR